jgi:7,8-dihydroneopterin aldolase/epimerase/oxygenase
MGKIALEGMEFFAYHGFYKSEREIGNKYGVDVEITVDFSNAAESDNLQETVNYEKLYKIIGEAMGIPAKLLEHIAEKIAETIFQHFGQVQDVTVTVRKFNPPIGGICHSARVTLYKSR